MPGNSESITESQLGFALKLLQSQHSDNTSSVFSPVSIAIALATVHLGAQGDTEKQIRNALAEGFEESDIYGYFKTLIKGIKDGYGVKVPSPEPEIDPNDKEALERRRFKLACLRDCNPCISACVLEIFSRVYIDDNIILKNNFVEKFNEFNNETIEKVNFAKAAMVAQAKMMQQGAKEWRYSETDAFQMLTLGYQYNDLSMRIILPKNRYGLADIIKNLTANELLNHLTKRDKAETDEEGTEAAAITAIYLMGCNLREPPPPIKFTANHPFIYLITDSKNNIYFCGVVSGAEFDDCGSYQFKEKLSKNPVTSFAKKFFGKKP
uniref:Serpin domain-containing protein n=1 Tax=Panagrolaimus davidi TaxID=227884 RepID=A0A914NYY2_9BILA